MHNTTEDIRQMLAYIADRNKRGQGCAHGWRISGSNA
jgi:hypothetical protein